MVSYERGTPVLAFRRWSYSVVVTRHRRDRGVNQEGLRQCATRTERDSVRERERERVRERVCVREKQCGEMNEGSVVKALLKEVRMLEFNESVLLLLFSRCRS